jgi:hypothetical protein
MERRLRISQVTVSLTWRERPSSSRFRSVIARCKDFCLEDEHLQEGAVPPGERGQPPNHQNVGPFADARNRPRHWFDEARSTPYFGGLR